MPQFLVYILLLLALALPVLGAVALRLAGPHLAPAQFYGAAGGVLGLVLISVLLLARGDVPSLQIGSLSILLPVSSPGDVDLNLPAEPPDVPPADEPSAMPATGVPTLPSGTPTVAATVVATAAPTITPTATPAPTITPTTPPAPTEAPTAAPTAAPSGPRTYTVQSGDTLRTIAEQFNLSVQAIIDANRLTPAQADSLRVGQELVIP